MSSGGGPPDEGVPGRGRPSGGAPADAREHPFAAEDRTRDFAARRDLQRLAGLIESIEREISEPYRVEAFRLLGASVAPGAGARSQASTQAGSFPSERGQRRADPNRSRLNLSEYTGILAAPGRTLLKALVALDATASQLGVDWMSPSEIERFLVDRAGIAHVYRTNLSNALRGARPMADRRRRGRGYEYRITLAGREALEREQKVLGG